MLVEKSSKEIHKIYLKMEKIHTKWDGDGKELTKVTNAVYSNVVKFKLS